MQITITGPRGSGKTTLAAYLAKCLTDAGQQVKLHCPTDVTAIVDGWAGILQHGEGAAMTTRAHIAIVTGFDEEDEDAVHTRKPATPTRFAPRRGDREIGGKGGI